LHRVRTKFGFGISRNHVKTVADAQGHFRLTGLPKGPDNLVAAGPPEGEPYLTTEQVVTDPPGLDPINVDFVLKRGVWLNIHVFDKTTGKPVNSQIEYAIFEDNQNGKELGGLAFEPNLQTQASTGTLRMVGLPGHGLVGARPFDNRYPRSDGANIKGARQDGVLPTYPILMSPGNFSGLVEINPAPGAQTVKVDISLEQGGQLTGTVLDLDGKPLAGVRASGLGGFKSWEHEPLPTAEFTVKSLRPGKPLLLQFAHPEKKLAGFVLLKGNEKGPITAKLGPAATIRGRLVTKDGVPITSGELVGLQSVKGQPGDPPFDPKCGLLPRDIYPDKEGRFVIEGLASGLTYQLGLLRNRVYLTRLELKGSELLNLKSSETIDLGDVVVNLVDN
jgi:hypothetical protein